MVKIKNELIVTTLPFQHARVRGILFSLPEGTLTSALLSRINLATE